MHPVSAVGEGLEPQVFLGDAAGEFLYRSDGCDGIQGSGRDESRALQPGELPGVIREAGSI